MIEDQPPPIPRPDLRPTWDLVISDLEEMRSHDARLGHQQESVVVLGLVISDARDRDRIGRERYGTPLTAANGRNHLVDAYQEALDLCVYLRNETQESHSGLVAQACYEDALWLTCRLRKAIEIRANPGRFGTLKPCEMMMVGWSDEPKRACGATPTVGGNGRYRYCARHMAMVAEAGSTTLVYDEEKLS